MPIFKKLRLHKDFGRMSHLNPAAVYLTTPQTARSTLRSPHMKTSVVAFVLAGLLSGLSLVAAAQQHSACAGKPLTEAHSLENLPPQLNSLLGRNRRGLEGIADRNGKFNVTDVVDSELPMRRFVLGGLSASCAIVVVERGGRAHTYEVVEFEYTKAKWRVAQRRGINAAPRSIQELVAHVSK